MSRAALSCRGARVRLALQLLPVSTPVAPPHTAAAAAGPPGRKGRLRGPGGVQGVPASLWGQEPSTPHCMAKESWAAVRPRRRGTHRMRPVPYDCWVGQLLVPLARMEAGCGADALDDK